MLPARSVPFTAPATAEAAEPATSRRPDQNQPVELAPAKAVSTSEQELSLDEYVAIRIALDATDDPAPVLAVRGMSLDQWHRLRRRWHQRTLDAPELAAELRTKLSDARRSSRKR